MLKKGMVMLLITGLGESLIMTLGSTLAAYLIGLPLGVILVVMDKDGIFPVPPVNKALGFVINVFRSVPFLILMITIMPFTRALVGTTIGTKATMVALIVASAPYIARLVESSLREVDRGVIEAAQSMGASPFQIVMKVLLPEAMPSLLVGAAIAVTTVLSYSAMAGMIGGGGLGAISINYGYHRRQTDVMLVSVFILVVIVQVLQEIGMRIAKIGDKRA